MQDRLLSYGTGEGGRACGRVSDPPLRWGWGQSSVLKRRWDSFTNAGSLLLIIMI